MPDFFPGQMQASPLNRQAIFWASLLTALSAWLGTKGCTAASVSTSSARPSATLELTSNAHQPLASLTLKTMSGGTVQATRTLSSLLPLISQGTTVPRQLKSERTAAGGWRLEYELSASQGMRAVVLIRQVRAGVYDLSGEVFSPKAQRLTQINFPQWSFTTQPNDEVYPFTPFKYKMAFFRDPRHSTGGQPFHYLGLGQNLGLVGYAVWPKFNHSPETVRSPGNLRISSGQKPGTLHARYTWHGYTWKRTGQEFSWPTPTVRLQAATDIDAALNLLAKDMETGPLYTRKLAAYPRIGQDFKTHLFLKWSGSGKNGHFDRLAAQLSTLEMNGKALPLLLHPVILGRDFDHRYPEFLPAGSNKGGNAALQRFYRAAHNRGMRVGPYTNVTWWGDTSPFDKKPIQSTQANRSLILEKLQGKWTARGKPYAAMAQRDSGRKLAGVKTKLYGEWYPNTRQARLHHFGWRMSMWHPDLLREAERLYRQLTGHDDTYGDFNSDFLFLDQIQTRNFLRAFGDYDFNNDYGIKDRYTPYGLQDGLDNLARVASLYAPVAIEGHGLTTLSHVMLFGSGFLSSIRKAAAADTLFTADQELVGTNLRFYRKYVSLMGHNLEDDNLPVGDYTALGSHLALGLRLYASAQGPLAEPSLRDAPEFLDWVTWLALLQQHVASRYEGVAMMPLRRAGDRLLESQFGNFRVVWNLADTPATLDAQTVVSPRCFFASDPGTGLQAGCLDRFGELERGKDAPPLRVIFDQKAGIRYVWRDTVPGLDQ